VKAAGSEWMAVRRIRRLRVERVLLVVHVQRRLQHADPLHGRCDLQPLAPRSSLGYPGRTMPASRPGRTVKVSISLDRDDLATLKRRARESYGGNLSAAFADAARWIRRQEARRRLIDMLGGPSLTPEIAAAIDAEQQGLPLRRPRKPRRTRAA